MRNISEITVSQTGLLVIFLLHVHQLLYCLFNDDLENFRDVCFQLLKYVSKSDTGGLIQMIGMGLATM